MDEIKNDKKNRHCIDPLIKMGISSFLLFHNIEKSILTFKKVLEIDPSNKQGLFWLGWVLYKNKQYDKAKSVLDTNLATHFESPDFLVLQAKILSRSGNSDESIELYENVFKKEPNWILPQISLTYLLLAKKNVVRARQIAEHVVKIGKNTKLHSFDSLASKYHETCITGRAICLDEKINRMLIMLKKQIAEINIEKRLIENPNDIQALIEKGFWYFSRENTTDAIKTFINVSNLYSNNVDALFWHAIVLFADNLNFEKAKNLLQKALVIDPNRADCHCVLADVFGELSDINKRPKLYLKKSIDHFKRVIELEPNWIWPRIKTSHRLIENNQIDLAELQIFEAMRTFEICTTPEISNRMEKYFESCITGRTSVKKAHFDQLLERIKEIRSETASL